MADDRADRLDRLELDPRIISELHEARASMTEAMGRLTLLELELKNYIREEREKENL